LSPNPKCVYRIFTPRAAAGGKGPRCPALAAGARASVLKTKLLPSRLRTIQ
jgi:hypothetical protein